jgi:hypothetical protein
MNADMNDKSWAWVKILPQVRLELENQTSLRDMIIFIFQACLFSVFPLIFGFFSKISHYKKTKIISK